MECKKKVTPYPGHSRVTCQSTTCKRKMKISRCKSTYSVEVTVLDKSNQQHVLTIFPSVLEVIETNGSPDEIEDKILDLENLDIYYNKKKVIVNITDHVNDH